MSSRPLRIGTRGSPLALAQADEVRRELAGPDPAVEGEIVAIRTAGDRLAGNRPPDGKGAFTKEIEIALLAGEIDVAVHSMKDVPTRLPDGLLIDCFLPRGDPRDALIAPQARGLAELPVGATVGTSSLRRKALLLHRRPDLDVVPLRGNVDTRLGRMASGDMDATLLAVAGLDRLGRTGVEMSPLDPADMLPAVCQGIIGVERRADDERTAGLIQRLGDDAAAAAAAAERTLLAGLDGSCRTPIAALAQIDGDRLSLRSAIVRPDGSELLETAREGARADAARLGADAAAELRSRATPGFFGG